MTGPARNEWDELAKLWLGAPPQLWRRHSDAVNVALLERWLPLRVGRVLKTDLWDEALGTGLVATLAARAESVTGVDLSAEVVERARARHAGLHGEVADVRGLRFPDASFDTILSNSTLDHFESREDLVAALRELRRVLVPGGELILTLDNPLNPVLALLRALPRGLLNRGWLRVAGPAGSLGLNPYHLGATMGTRTLRRILPSLGYEVLDSTSIVHAPRPLAVVAGQLVERRGSISAERRYLRLLARFERLSALPTRSLTAYFVAVKARAIDS
ncbi:MAG: class I SAM-dependent methyltransferase [Gaiellaceae bacterium]